MNVLGKMLWDAEIRIKERYANYSLRASCGHNLSIHFDEHYP